MSENDVRPVAGQPPKRAFTLIELLGVIAIMLILAGLVITLLPATNEKSMRTQAQRQFQALKGALEGYKAEYGRYPADDKVYYKWDKLAFGGTSNEVSGGVSDGNRVSELTSGVYNRLKPYMPDSYDVSLSGRGTGVVCDVGSPSNALANDLYTYSVAHDPWGGAWSYNCYTNYYKLSCSRDLGAGD